MQLRRGLRKVYGSSKRSALAVIGLIVLASVNVLAPGGWHWLADQFHGKKVHAKNAAIQVKATYDWVPVDAFFAFKSPLSRVSKSKFRSLFDLAETPAERDAVRMTYPTNGTSGSTRIKVVVQNNGRATAVVTGMRARILNRSQPVSGALVGLIPQGETPNTMLRLNLDTSIPLVRTRIGGAPYFLSKSVSLKQDEPHTFEIEASTIRSYIEWQLLVDVNVGGGETRTFGVGDYRTNRPFRSTAIASRYASCYLYDFPSGELRKGWPLGGGGRPYGSKRC
jgi:hypothetical protein